jgi:DNA-binding winged helix-turn-helix (wHTH) protein
MVEYECQHGRMAGKVLPATYINFGLALSTYSGQSQQSLHQAHLHCVVETATLSLLNYLRENPEQVSSLGYGGSQRLSSLLCGYTNLFDPFKLDETLRRVNADEQVLNTRLFLEAVQAGKLGELLDRANLGRERPWVELLGEAAAYRGPVPPLNLALIEDLSRLVRLVGLQALYVLVDRVDELPETAADPAAGANLLRPLLADLRLMEIPGLAFKFFLPDEVVAALFAARELRPDRLTRYEIHWTTPQLVNFLHNRLLAYSRDNSLSSLAPFCEFSLADEVDEMLGRMAEGSPRNLLRLGELFIMEHCQGPDIDGPLRREELERAHRKLQESLRQELVAYSATVAPPNIEPEAKPLSSPPPIPLKGLYLDTARRQVWRDGQLIEPGPVGQEYTLLEYLYRNAGRAVSKDELLQVIYGSQTFLEASEEALAQMISRLRKKIEPAQKASQTTYIITVPRFGYKLENRAQE